MVGIGRARAAYRGAPHGNGEGHRAAADERPVEIDKRDIPLSGGRTLRVTEFGDGGIRLAVRACSPYVVTSLEQIDDGAVLTLPPAAKDRTPTGTGSATTATVTAAARSEPRSGPDGVAGYTVLPGPII
ncbi:hypothetical protein QFZ32_004936 [Streptomyces canus]|nr:hypothetical protein [Streptomyces canus]MDQ1069496.1 hypothetical protein [Streptomyces canus]